MSGKLHVEKKLSVKLLLTELLGYHRSQVASKYSFGDWLRLECDNCETVMSEIDLLKCGTNGMYLLFTIRGENAQQMEESETTPVDSQESNKKYNFLRLFRHK